MKENVKQKRKGLLIIIFALFIFILGLIPTFLMGVAYADGGGDSNGGGSEGGGDSDGLSGVYYFTDYDGSYKLYNDLIKNHIVDTINRYYWDYTQFQVNFLKEYDEGKFDELSNCYVIFEMRYGLKVEITGENNFVIKLRDFFRDLKVKGCQIMFICGTEEKLFAYSDEHTEFLDFVDIHVNTDLMSLFLKSVLSRETQKYNGGEEDVNILENCTILLDKHFAPDIDINDDESALSCWSLKDRIFPYLAVTWNWPLYTSEDYRDLLNAHKIKVLCHLDGNKFYYVNKKQTVTMNDYAAFYNGYVKNDNIFALGGTWKDKQYAANWAKLMTDLRDTVKSIDEGLYNSDGFFPIYVYNTNGFWTQEYNNEYVFTSGAVNKDKLYCIAEDFLTGGDLTQYDNYIGRCVITHKLIGFSEDGWITAFSANEIKFYLKCWGSYLEEYDYYFLFGAFADEEN
ncbi:MAG: hypothetical protein J1G01_06150 [Clostridiales bacterium]|nr:hypothetical protein [Clostridiales bacterium]